MDAFNVIAEQQIAIENERITTETAYEKQLALTNADQELNWINARIEEVTTRLAYFEGFDKKDDDKSLPACEPRHLYYLDDKNIP